MIIINFIINLMIIKTQLSQFNRASGNINTWQEVEADKARKGKPTMAPLYETLFLNFLEIEKSLDGAERKGNQQWLYFMKEQN